MLTVTFIRHGESEDNLRGVWAGWKDAPLSALGPDLTFIHLQQAYALGQRFKTVNLDAIYSSDLKRAHSTALALNDARPAEQQIPLTVNPKLREQHFGIAEGHKWALHPPLGISLEELFEQGIYPVLPGRDAKYPEGESLNDLAKRCEEALRECVLPHLNTRLNSDGTAKNSHIAITSHGLCI
ncbi:phosphoglycerate mutase-like protein, partial [Pluteus cervinus]